MRLAIYQSLFNNNDDIALALCFTINIPTDKSNARPDSK
jgi:hypothetical protein